MDFEAKGGLTRIWLIVDTDCLQKNSYKEEKCQSQVDRLYACCKAFYEKNGEDATTVSCPKANILKLKMKQRAQKQT
jgi:hypothetical protein